MKDVQQYPDAYQRERAARFGLCQKSICQASKRWRLTYKKMRGHPKADEEVRHLFQDKIACYQKQVKPLVYSMKEALPATCPPLRIFSTRSALF
ncbi:MULTISPECIES: IS630 transposase-related protein [Candidatus Williamhamiltonella]|uniref:IS630 transposase-related protein n=1 Tax=Candidatus Williamhamiltonella TaxID=568987 RepID=UPI000C1F0A70